MPWNTLFGHHDQVEMLRRSAGRSRLAHTYLFVGPAGVGKKRFALDLAQCLLCEAHQEEELLACGQCSGCKQVAARTHPDLMIVECPEGKSELPIDLFLGPPDRRGKAGLCYELSMRPMSGGRKLAIIDDADLLNDEGANALLKTLEEPPPRSILILIATSPDVVLPTIRSRCQVLRFRPLAVDDVRQILLREGMTETEPEAAEAAGMSEGSLERARQLLDPQLREQRTVLYDMLAAEKFQSAQLTAKMLEGLEAAGSETSVQRAHAVWMFRFCAEFYRQVLLIQAGKTDQTAEVRIPQVSRFVARNLQATLDDLELTAELLERCLTADRQLESKAAISLCVETLFADLGAIQRSAEARLAGSR